MAEHTVTAPKSRVTVEYREKIELNGRERELIETYEFYPVYLNETESKETFVQYIKEHHGVTVEKILNIETEYYKVKITDEQLFHAGVEGEQCPKPTREKK